MGLYCNQLNQVTACSCKVFYASQIKTLVINGFPKNQIEKELLINRELRNCCLNCRKIFEEMYQKEYSAWAIENLDEASKQWFSEMQKELQKFCLDENILEAYSTYNNKPTIGINKIK